MRNLFQWMVVICCISYLVVYPFMGCLGQEYTEIRTKPDLKGAVTSLKVGDSLPDFAISRLINYKGKGLRTGDFKDRLLLLDFWSVTCPGCVHALPKMYALQQQFKEKIRILPVTREEAGKVSTFWNTNGYTKNLPLLSVVEDTLFSAYLPHRYLPHEVWVYRGKVIAVTGAQYVDADQIKRVLSGEKISWPEKNDFYHFDFNAPLFALDTNQIDLSNTTLDYAALSGHRAGVNSGGLSGGMTIKRDPQKKTVRVYMVNTAPYTAYYLSFLSSGWLETDGQADYLSPNRIVWAVSDRNRLEYRGKEISGYQPEWVQANGICFESLHADTGQTDQQVYRRTIRELNNLLGLDVKWVRRTEKVFVLSRDSAATSARVLKQGVPSYSLVYTFNQRESNPYFFDESGGNVLLPKELLDLKDIAGLARAVKPFGLRLVESERAVNKLVFAETRPLLPEGKLIGEYQRRKSLEVKPLKAGDGAAFLERNKTAPGVVTLPSGLQYKVLRKGSGRMAGTTGKLAVHYTGMEVNGRIFESTLENGLPQVLSLSQMIPGWGQGAALMREGDKWTLYIPASLGFGSHSGGGRVPPESTLIYEIELIRVIP